MKKSPNSNVGENLIKNKTKINTIGWRFHIVFWRGASIFLALTLTSKLVLVETRSRSRENNTQLFSYTFALFHYALCGWNANLTLWLCHKTTLEAADTTANKKRSTARADQSSRILTQSVNISTLCAWQASLSIFEWECSIPLAVSCQTSSMKQSFNIAERPLKINREWQYRTDRLYSL